MKTVLPESSESAGIVGYFYSKALQQFNYLTFLQKVDRLFGLTN